MSVGLSSISFEDYFAWLILGSQTDLSTSAICD